MIEIDHNLEFDDTQQIESFLKKNFQEYKIEFKGINTIPTWLVKILYHQLYNLHKNLIIVVNQSRLSRYLHSLAIDAQFVSRLKRLQVDNTNINIIAIGGSADSGQKIIDIISGIESLNYSIFIIQHINPDKNGIFDEILTRYSQSNVTYAKDGDTVKSGHIYIASNNKHLLVKDNRIILSDAEHRHSARPSISSSFESLSNEYKDNFIAILECGYGKDGVDTLPLLHANKSTIIIQNPKDCEADSIVRQAINQKIYNYVFDTSDIISYINCNSISFYDNNKWIEYFLDEIQKRYEYDYRLYLKESVNRRIESFMIKHFIHDIKTFVILVLYNKKAFEEFFLELSINVTSFFRKIESSKKMIDILQNYKNSYNIKIWSAGCSSGEEVYSTAIILSELGLLHKSIIYATDFNPVVIEEAKNGIYSREIFEKAKFQYKELDFGKRMEDYFNINDKFVEIKEDIKEKVLFFVHNLEKDSVFNEFDIIECKNVLIYFNVDLQQRVFKLFYDSLKFAGHLLLGPSENLPQNFENKFQKCENDCKIYKKVA